MLVTLCRCCKQERGRTFQHQGTEGSAATCATRLQEVAGKDTFATLAANLVTSVDTPARKVVDRHDFSCRSIETRDKLGGTQPSALGARVSTWSFANELKLPVCCQMMRRYEVNRIEPVQAGCARSAKSTLCDEQLMHEGEARW